MKTEGIKIFTLILIAAITIYTAKGQTCTTLGQTPATAFPVCGTTTFQQSSVPICRNGNLFVPNCPAGDGYGDKNPFYYKFTCFVSGTLGFTINPIGANEDYDWQLYDITGRNPNDIYTNNSLVVTGNWSGTYGATGASASGISGIGCASDPSLNNPTFTQMPNIIQGHEYLLMISHFTDNQSGYNLSFGGGTAVITDPTMPHLASVKADCDGTTITVKLNKKVKCNSFTTSGSEFSIVPAVATVASAVTDSCSFGFDFDEITLTLSNPLPNGNYDLVINNGTDANTLRDNCDNLIPQGESLPFLYAIPQPIFADSIGTPGCAPDSVKVYFPKKIVCNTISANGSDFSVTGPSAVNVVAASGNCINNKTEYIIVKFANPIMVGGTYQLTLKAGDDGGVVLDECGQETPVHTLPFTTVDTVNAEFSYVPVLDCLKNTVTFSHNGAHGVNNWNWTFNGGTPVTTQTHTIDFPSISNNTIQLIASNGVCSDTATTTLDFNNEVKASFTISDNIICPEDKLEITNTSTGIIDSWLWKYDFTGSSTLQDPPPYQFPAINNEAYYTIKLYATNNTLGCTDSAKATITVLDHCLIEIPSAFTPNNDGLNDNFGPHNAIKADNYYFRIYNRWGQLVFETRNWRERWDGRVNGAFQTTNVFVWILSYTHRDTGNPVFRKGTVTVIR